MATRKLASLAIVRCSNARNLDFSVTQSITSSESTIVPLYLKDIIIITYNDDCNWEYIVNTIIIITTKNM